MKKAAQLVFQSAVGFCVFSSAIVSASSNTTNVDANQLVRRADLTRAPFTQFSCRVRVIDDDGIEKKQSLFRVLVKDERTSLVEQIEPERARGRKLLLKDFDMWLYTPNMKRATRISMEQKLTGEVSNGDLARTHFSQDYGAQKIGTENILGKETLKLELLAKNKNVTYRKIHYWIETDSAVPVKAQFFALSGKLLKEAIYQNLKSELGVKIIHEMIITDALRKNKTSSLVYSDYKAEKFSDAKFNKESLDQD